MKFSIIIMSLFFIISCNTNTNENKNTHNKFIKTLPKKQDTFNVEQKILEIEKYYKEIEANLTTYKKREKKIEDEMVISAFYDKNRLVKLIFVSEFDNDIESASFYLKNDELFFMISEYTSKKIINDEYTVYQKKLFFHENIVIKSFGKEKTFNINSVVNMENVKSFPINKLKESEYHEIKEMINYCIEALDNHSTP